MAVDKQLQGSDWGAELSKEQYMYAALDAVLTHAVAVKLAERVKKHGLERAYKSIRDTQMIVAKMELNGMPVDWEYHRTLIDQWKAEEEKASVAVKQYFGDINVASPKQMRQWLEKTFSREELKAWPRTKPTSKAPNGNYSFEHDQISFMRNVPAVGALLEYKRWAKLLSTYGESLREKRNPVTGNIHTSFTLCSTATGRMSSRNPNVQNMPSEDWFRNVFCAPPGWSLVVSDFSQIELRLQAEMSQDPQMLKIYRDGLDAYCEMAGSVYGGKVTKEDKAKRSVGKVLMLSLGYGMGVNTLERRGKIAGIYQPRSFWEKAFKAYKDKFKHYAKWCENIRTRATKLGYIDTLGGMRRKLDPDFIYTQSVNTVIQGTAAELMRLALQKVDKEVASYGYIVAPVHDEIVLAVPNEASEEASKALTNGMCSAMQEMFPKAASHNVAKAAVASRWGEAKGEL
jgi:DNA polymerase-1